MWQETKSQLTQEFTFSDFKTALEFVNKVGGVAEKLNHHPDFSLSFGKVKISLTTHESGKVTTKDREIAQLIDKIKR